MTRQTHVAALGLLIASFAVAEGRAETALPQTDLVQVAISGELNLRAGPSTTSARLRRLSDGTLLRRVECETRDDEGWCEVETLDGGLEGWAAAQFLNPWLGADPAVLQSSVIEAMDRISVEAPGEFAGQLERGEVFDLVVSVPTDNEIVVLLDGGGSVGGVVFWADGALAEQIEPGTELFLDELQETEILVRIAEMQGEPTEWSLSVALN